MYPKKFGDINSRNVHAINTDRMIVFTLFVTNVCNPVSESVNTVLKSECKASLYTSDLSRYIREQRGCWITYAERISSW